MISDVFYEARISAQEYLDSESTGSCYTGEMRTKIERLLREMQAIQFALDIPPVTQEVTTVPLTSEEMARAFLLLSREWERQIGLRMAEGQSHSGAVKAVGQEMTDWFDSRRVAA